MLELTTACASKLGWGGSAVCSQWVRPIKTSVLLILLLLSVCGVLQLCNSVSCTSIVWHVEYCQHERSTRQSAERTTNDIDVRSSVLLLYTTARKRQPQSFQAQASMPNDIVVIFPSLHLCYYSAVVQGGILVL